LQEIENQTLEEIETEWKKMMQTREDDFKKCEEDYLLIKVKINKKIFLLTITFIFTTYIILTIIHIKSL